MSKSTNRFRLPVLVAAFLLLLGAPASDATAQATAPSPVPDDTQVEAVAEGFQFTEGPHWYEGPDGEDGTLLFSDIPANTIYRWHPEADSTSVFRRPSGHSNGIVAGPKAGSLLLAQHGWRRVARVRPDGRETALATHYEGKRLNSPNDVALASDGTVYFTDPPYGVEEDARALDFSGVYRLREGASSPELITKAFERPNGVVLSPDDARLYVNDTRQRLIRVYEVDGESLSEGRVFARLDDPDAEGGPDGMTVDTQGRVYSTGPGGLWIFSPEGTLVDRIEIPAQATNVTFGGPEHQTLFVTTPSTVYRVRVNATGAR